MQIGAYLMLLASTAQSAPPGPNVILFLADDQGWTGTSVASDPRRPDSRSDFYRTPQLERLARQGMRFSNAYAPHPNCSPARLAIQTGKSPAQMRMTDIIGRNSGVFYQGNRMIPPSSLPGLPTSEVTLAEMLKKAKPEYATAHFGKWHLGGGGPGKHGYDEHDEVTGNRGRGSLDDPNPKDIFGISYRAVAFMRAQALAGRPFFMQVSHYAVHMRARALQSTISQYLQAKPGTRHDSPLYAAMTTNLDDGLGRILDELDELGLADTTYVIYTSDNGAYVREGHTNNLPLANGKATVWEGGIRVPLIVRGPGIAGGGASNVPVVGQDLFPTILKLLGVELPMPPGVEGGSIGDLLVGRGGGKVNRPHEVLVWHFPHYDHEKGTTPQSAVRDGDWKLIKFHETGEVKLFNLAEDLGERHDLAAERPQMARKLERKLSDYLETVGAAMPKINEAFDESEDPAPLFDKEDNGVKP